MISVGDDEFDVSFPIGGLQFEANLVENVSGPSGWFTTKLLSSQGPLVSDFVTHEIGFIYNTYGIHVGQIDRLTFMGQSDVPIIGHFVDCRADSPTLHEKVSARYSPSLWRRLIVPRGVAHTFDNLAQVVTRDEPVWYADFDNIDWDVNNDLVSIPRISGDDAYPVVRINDYRMPDEAHRFVSRLSQSLLETPIAYASRHLLTIGGEDKYVMFQAKSWTDNEAEVARLLDVPRVPGITVSRARYALTGPRSWTLVPSTGSCVADVLALPAAGGASQSRFLHRRTRKWYTFLTNPGSAILIESADYRAGSETFGDEGAIRMTADPRIRLAIDPGIAYAISCDEEMLVRCEHEVFVADDEPRSDLPHFGSDLIVLSHGERPISDPALPSLRCPDEVVRSMARAEQELVQMAR